MAAGANEIQSFGYKHRYAFAPMYGYDYLTGANSTLVWLPSAMRKLTGQKGDMISISIENDNDRGLFIPEGTSRLWVWLPTQSDFQRMLGDNIAQVETAIYKGSYRAKFITAQLRKFECKGRSAEELWLKAVMFFAFNKVWEDRIDMENKWEDLVFIPEQIPPTINIEE